MNKIYFVLLIFCNVLAFSQDKIKIKILQANELNSPDGVAQNLIGDVILRCEGTLLKCDKAIVYFKDNFAKAIGNVRVFKDSLLLTSNFLDYNGNQSLMKSWENVVMTKGKTKLYTEIMYLNNEKNLAYYVDGGKIIDEKEGIIISKKADFFTKTDYYEFKDSVKIDNKDYKIVSDNIGYDKKKDFINILAHTKIIIKDMVLYSDKGIYNKGTKKSHLIKNNRVFNGENYIFGDSLYVNEIDSIFEGNKNVVIGNSKNKMEVRGNYARYNKKIGKGLVTQNAFMVSYNNLNDTLFLSCDTIRVFDDGQNDRKIVAFNDVDFFKSDSQGSCDSLVYLTKDSTMYMYKNPILWNYPNQIKGELIKIFQKNGAADSIAIIDKSTLISKKDNIIYNQIKGKNMYGKIKQNKVDYVIVSGNAESIYYLEDKKKNVGLNRSKSSDMKIFFKNNKVDKILFKQDVSGKISPNKLIKEEMRMFKEFIWLDDIRPKSKHDILHDVKKAKSKIDSDLKNLSKMKKKK